MYNIYCWGFSSIWISVGFYFQHSQTKVLRELAPDIGISNCWFSCEYDHFKINKFYCFLLLFNMTNDYYLNFFLLLLKKKLH